MAYRVAIDIGGTFTDLVLEDVSAGRLSTAKVLSTPGHLVDGVVAAVRASEVPAAEIELFVHGTTAGLNALLERRGAKVALVTTRGFRDVYPIGRGNRPQMYDLHYVKPEALVDRAMIFEVDERIAADGRELEPVDLASVDRTAEAIAAGGFDAVAVSLLHGYADGAHEQQVADRLAEKLGLPVVTSHVVAPEWREYERTSTTVMSAYITPIMRRYLDELTRALAAEGLQVPVYITESNGGMMSAAVADDKAILTLFSGPVGGVVGTRAAGAALGLEDLITIDMGGTSFDVSLVRGGEAGVMSEFELQGLPVLAPAVEVHTIGAGGGSLIREVGGALRVGPESAGARPGPASYGNGGAEPTITDANVALGRLPSGQRLAGSMELDRDAAIAALEQVGARFGIGATELAEQALEIAHFAMAEAIRELTIERGLDPRDFVLCAFGGAGGLHATALAEELEIRRVLVPAMPGAFSAWGMLQGDVRHDAVQTFYRSLERAPADLPGAAAELEQRVAGLLAADGVDGRPVRFEVAGDLRYLGQEYTLTLPLAEHEVADLAAHSDALVARFHAAYHERYGHASADQPVEFVAIRIAAIAELERSANGDGGGAAPAAADGSPLGSSTYLQDGAELEAALWPRAAIAGPVQGPAIVLEQTCTTVVGPGWTARPVADGHLLLEKD
ncbi:hydantoinase/oxoprolinase family protein [Conexibacter arvalis]|uniref:N-methylhydantoinase A n=1 Tax=Conexibacter arvalis TaxID=912552 RepID=A0A840IBM1_9ACTN|nr:N-methylhydantoinase A [Conexibacter arvalis]